MKKIAVIGGDGTGPEVVAEGLKCLKAVSDKVGFRFETTPFDWGGEHYLKTGEILPAMPRRRWQSRILPAPSGPDVKPVYREGHSFNLRFALDQSINLRRSSLRGVETPLAGKRPRYRFRVCARTPKAVCRTGGSMKKGRRRRGGAESVNTAKVERASVCVRTVTKRNKMKKLTLGGKTLSSLFMGSWCGGHGG